MTFPKNNLPVQAQPWTRDVEKRVTNLESTFRSAEVNNVTRDSQALVQIRRLDAAVINAAQAAANAATAAANAQAAIDGLGSLDEATSTYKINASNITVGSLSGNRISGGTISGVNFETVSGTESLTLSSGKINFFENGTGIGSMAADTDGTDDFIQISSGSGLGQLTVGSDYSVLAGSGCAVQPGVVSSGRIDITGTSVFCNATLSVTGNLSASAGIALNNTNLTGVNEISNVVTGGSVCRTVLAGGGTTTANITNGGFLVRGTSSERYKQDIAPLSLNLQDVYELQPKTFRRIEEVEEDGENARTYPGFIAEDLAGTSLDKFVFYSNDEDGNPRPEGIHYAELTAALLLTIQDLNARIQVLENRV